MEANHSFSNRKHCRSSTPDWRCTVPSKLPERQTYPRRQLARMGPRPRSDALSPGASALLSPARQALAEHLALLAKLREKPAF
jgi:hypothetical protein